MEKIVRIEVVDSEEQVVHALIQFVEEKSKAAIAKRDRFVIGLSGKFHQMLFLGQYLGVSWIPPSFIKSDSFKNYTNCIVYYYWVKSCK